MSLEMEKLIELINEHQKEIHPDGIYLPVVAYRDGIFFSDGDCLSWVMDEIHLISKPYGFIKWLVDNDKIEKEGGICPRKELVKDEIIEDRETQKPIGYKNKYTEYEQLLMYLAIQDEPITTLIGILK